FVYYNIFVMNKTTDFAKFLAALKSTDNLDQIKKHYKAFMGLELEVSIQNWKDWLLTITQDSNIYVNWD
ncbi:MAG: hypothetical protein N2376_01605, partial [Clostridia bacterium]|nr:hypothetical protein [Clostridia bacterium]